MQPMCSEKRIICYTLRSSIIQVVYMHEFIYLPPVCGGGTHSNCTLNIISLHQLFRFNNVLFVIGALYCNVIELPECKICVYS